MAQLHFISLTRSSRSTTKLTHWNTFMSNLGSRCRFGPAKYSLNSLTLIFILSSPLRTAVASSSLGSSSGDECRTMRRGMTARSVLFRKSRLCLAFGVAIDAAGLWRVLRMREVAYGLTRDCPRLLLFAFRAERRGV